MAELNPENPNGKNDLSDFDDWLWGELAAAPVESSHDSPSANVPSVHPIDDEIHLHPTYRADDSADPRYTFLDAEEVANDVANDGDSPSVESLLVLDYFKVYPPVSWPQSSLRDEQYSGSQLQPAVDHFKVYPSIKPSPPTFTTASDRSELVKDATPKLDSDMAAIEQDVSSTFILEFDAEELSEEESSTSDLAFDLSFDMADLPFDSDIEEIDEDFGLVLELDPTFEAALALTKQQDYSRKVGALAAQMITQYQQYGGITYRALMSALRTLDRNEIALGELCAELQRADVRVKRAPHLYSFNRLSSSDHALINAVFRPILVRRIDPGVALRRLGYEEIAVSAADRELLLDALELHQLTRAEEREAFAEIARLGGPDVLAARPIVHQLIEDNLWLVARQVRHYLNRGLPFADLFQEGVIALYRAIKGFDTSLQLRFMIYASHWVRQAITRAIDDSGRVIRLPVHVSELMSRLSRETLSLEQSLQREPTNQEMAQQSGVPAKKLLSLQHFMEEPLSLEVLTADPDFDIADESQDPTFDLALQHSLREEIDAVLSKLSDRQRGILELRYGLIDGKQRTLEEVAQEFNITRERVRQIEAKILTMLSDKRLSGNLRSYLAEPETRRIRVPEPAQVSIPAKLDQESNSAPEDAPISAPARANESIADIMTRRNPFTRKTPALTVNARNVTRQYNPNEGILPAKRRIRKSLNELYQDLFLIKEELYQTSHIAETAWDHTHDRLRELGAAIIAGNDELERIGGPNLTDVGALSEAIKITTQIEKQLRVLEKNGCISDRARRSDST